MVTKELSPKLIALIERKRERYPDADCLNCPLLAQPVVDGYVESDDLNDVQAVYIAEHPGSTEARTGIPLSGQAGECLRIGIKAVEGDWKRSYRTNAVMCVPPYGSKLDKKSVECCRPRLDREVGEITRRNPGVRVMALGNFAAQSIHHIAGKKTSAKISTLRGSNITVPKWGTRSHFTYNPAYILRQKQMAPLFADDLQKMLFGMEYPYPKLAQEPPEARYCLTPQDAVTALKSLKIGPIAYDIETATAITFNQIRSESGWLTAFGITDSSEYCYVMSPEVMRDDSVQAVLHTLVHTEGVQVIAHNGKFDQLFMREKEGIDIPLHFDTMLAHYVLDENNYHDLKTVARQFLGVPDYDAEVEKYVYKKKGLKKVKWYDKVPFPVLTQYLAYDVCCTWALQQLFQERMIAEDLYDSPFSDTIMPASDLLLELEERGMTIDTDYFESQVATVSVRAAELTLQMRRISGKSDLNPRSWVQVQPILYEQLGFPKVSGKNFKAGSTSKDALKKIREVMRSRTGDEAWDHPFIEAKLAYSRVNKMLTAYIQPLQTWPHPETRRVHTTFYVHGTVTGRLASRDPALQVIPRPTDRWGRIIRAGFIAAPGMVLCKIDQSQCELRVCAIESQDHYLMTSYNNGVDLHSDIAKLVVELTPNVNWSQEVVQPRSVAKIINFGYIYDATPAGLVQTFPSLIDMPLARRIHSNYDQKLAGATLWKHRTKLQAWNHGYVETVFGRRRRFPVVAKDNRTDIGRQAVNFPIQSIASDLVLKAGIRLRPKGIPMVLLVHDEIIFEARHDEARDMMDVVAAEMLAVSQEYSDDIVWKVDGSIRDRWAALTPEAEAEYDSFEWSSR